MVLQSANSSIQFCRVCNAVPRWIFSLGPTGTCLTTLAKFMSVTKAREKSTLYFWRGFQVYFLMHSKTWIKAEKLVWNLETPHLIQNSRNTSGTLKLTSFNVLKIMDSFRITLFHKFLEVILSRTFIHQTTGQFTTSPQSVLNYLRSR